MPTLKLGVNEIPYAPGSVEPAPKLTKSGRIKRATARRLARQAQTSAVGKAAQTTGDVATALEEKYHVMEVFVAANEDAIGKALTDGMEGALEDLVLGAPTADPFSQAGTDIGAMFKTWLSSGAIEQLGIPGVPTKASLDRKSLRFKKKVGPAKRPSFIDTGAYEGSFVAWVE